MSERLQPSKRTVKCKQCGKWNSTAPELLTVATCGSCGKRLRRFRLGDLSVLLVAAGMLYVSLHRPIPIYVLLAATSLLLAFTFARLRRLQQAADALGLDEVRGSTASFLRGSLEFLRPLVGVSLLYSLVQGVLDWLTLTVNEDTTLGVLSDRLHAVEVSIRFLKFTYLDPLKLPDWVQLLVILALAFLGVLSPLVKQGELKQRFEKYSLLINRAYILVTLLASFTFFGYQYSQVAEARAATLNRQIEDIEGGYAEYYRALEKEATEEVVEEILEDGAFDGVEERVDEFVSENRAVRRAIEDTATRVATYRNIYHWATRIQFDQFDAGYEQYRRPPGGPGGGSGPGSGPGGGPHAPSGGAGPSQGSGSAGDRGSASGSAATSDHTPGGGGAPGRKTVESTTTPETGAAGTVGARSAQDRSPGVRDEHKSRVSSTWTLRRARELRAEQAKIQQERAAEARADLRAVVEKGVDVLHGDVLKQSLVQWMTSGELSHLLDIALDDDVLYNLKDEIRAAVDGVFYDPSGNPLSMREALNGVRTRLKGFVHQAAARSGEKYRRSAARLAARARDLKRRAQYLKLRTPDEIRRVSEQEFAQEWRAFDRKWDRHFSFRGFGGVRRAGRQLRSRARQQLLTLHHPLRRLAEMDRWSAELGLDQKRVRSAEDQVAVLTSFDADHIKDPTSFYSEAARSAVAFQQAEEEGTWGAVRAQLRQAFERSRIEALHAATPGEQAVLLRDAPRSQELEVVEIVERWQREKSHRALDLMLSGRRPSQIEPAEWERLFFNYCVSEEGSPMGAVWSFAAHSWGPESARGETAAEGFLNYVREAGLGEPMAAWQKVMRHAPASRAFDIMCPGSDPDHVVTAPSDPYGLKSEFPGIDGLGSFEQRFRRRLDY